MTTNERAEKGQLGQTLPLFGLFITTLLLFALAVVDVGFFLHEREQVQAAADAAALAGAQELPDSTTNARAVALDYLTKNDISTDGVVISFRCTSGVASICDGTTTFDTIVVKPRSQSPQFFGGILSLIGSESCWITGCNVSAQAAGCRGACGPIGTGPADIMVMLDHSASMSTTDLGNAKNATLQMFTDLNNQYQRVGLAVTPPVNGGGGDTCDTIDHWADSKLWMPSGLTFNYQTSPHVLNNTSGPAYQTSCLDRANFSWPGELTDYPFCSCHTDVGSGIQAANAEISANARLVDNNGTPVVHGLIIVTDGAANVAPYTTTTTTTTNYSDTGWNFCNGNSSYNAALSGGDNNGYDSNRSNGCANGNGYATDWNSGSGTATNCDSTQKDKHAYWGFNLSNDIPSNGVVTGMEIRIDAWANDASRMLCVDYSTDSGSSWTAVGTINLTGSEQTYNLGSSTNLAGLGLGDPQFGNSNFRLRLTQVSVATGTDFNLDALATKVYYSYDTSSSSTSFSGSLGPCDWAVQQANAAKASGIEIYVIGFGVSSTERCSNFSELPSSPYYNTYSTVFLCSLATDAQHCYNEPKTEDLEPVFQEIGAQLVQKGSKLVE